MADVPARSRHHDLFEKFYGDMGKQKSDGGVYNIDVSDFNPDMYLHKIFEQYNLGQLTSKEVDIKRQIQLLDNEMQKLVYENYNKFISATDTIRKMKNDFKEMEEQMDHLSSNMAVITDFSANISNSLQGRKQKISKLSGTHTVLKKLQFLFELPPRMKLCIENESYGLAVRHYLKAQKVLHQYQDMPSFHGIQKDCDNIVAQLKAKLRSRFKSKVTTPKELSECINLLLQLQEPTEVLCDEFLEHSRSKLNSDLEELLYQVKIAKGEFVPKTNDQEKTIGASPANHFMDILEFVDLSYSKFLNNMSLAIASYGELFLQHLPSEGKMVPDSSVALRKLDAFVKQLMQEYFQHIEDRIALENHSAENAILVRALDRFHRRIQAIHRLLPHVNLAEKGMQIVSRAARDCCFSYLKTLKQLFSDCLINIRQNLAVSTIPGNNGGSNRLNDLLNLLLRTITDGLKSTLSNLEHFIQQDVTFATSAKFRNTFCRDYVREGTVVSFFSHINTVASDFCTGSGDKNMSPPPQLLLLLSRVCLEMEQSTVSYMLSLADEHFSIQDKENLSSVSDLCLESKDTAQKLLDYFVNIQGLSISQMLRKSVETRDWLNAIEPRSVRAVMKRVVEDVTAIDAQVGQLYEEGVKKEGSSDSSRRTYPSFGKSHRSKYNAYAPSTIDNSLMSNIQKLFSERIEIFSAVEFSKVSVMTGIIKISLKTFLECVRLRTFSCYGLQQNQVDTHYLQLYLWHFVADENLVHVLLDEIMSSSINRCLNPVLMEPSVVEVICERG